jgi:DNA gyrase/topoisomerase IV subunit B
MAKIQPKEGRIKQLLEKHYVKTIREFFGKNYDASDVRKSIIAAISIKVMEPVFESQTKTKLGSTEMGDGMPTVRSYINDFLGTQLDNFLHKNPDTAASIQRKIMQAEKNAKSSLESESWLEIVLKKRIYTTKIT